jgi:hypothetical protein
VATYRTAGRLRVRAGRMVKTRKTQKTGTRTAGIKGKTAGRFHETKQTGNRQTENTGINTQGIMGKIGNTWRGWRQAQRQVEQIRV